MKILKHPCFGTLNVVNYPNDSQVNDDKNISQDRQGNQEEAVILIIFLLANSNLDFSIEANGVG